MFRVAFVILTITLGVKGVSPNIDDILACVQARVLICKPLLNAMIKDIADMTETTAEQKYESICEATRVYDDCYATDLHCGGAEWDYDCFVTNMVEFLEDANLCEGFKGHGSEKETALAKNCLDYIVEVMTTKGDHQCVYTGEIAKCFLTTQPSLRGEFIDGFRESTRRQIRYNFPHTFGDITMQICPEWNSTYADLLSE